MGRKGSGKTTLTRSLLHDEKRYIIADSLNEYDAPQIAATESEISRECEKKLNGKLRLCIKVGSDQMFDAACDAAYITGKVKPVLFVIEEADMRCSPSYVTPSLDRLIRYGRHWGVSILAVARRPAEVTRHLTAQADTIAVFRTHEPRDLEFFKQRCGEEFARALPKLKQYHYVTWGDELAGAKKELDK
jgi:hypothetical protein